MAEITEYTLAVLVSTLLVGGSAATYTAFARLEAASEVDASMSALLGLADDAVVNGHSNSSLLLPTSTLTCERGVLAISSGNSTASSSIGVPCDFAVDISGGVHLVSFENGPSGLQVQVT